MTRGSDLLVIVPSRGRPGSCGELIESWQGATADLLIAVDDDDPELAGYQQLNAWIEVGPRLRLGPTLNAMAERFGKDYLAVGFMGDDHRPRTQGWDVQLLQQALAVDVPGIAYGNDLLQGGMLPTAVVIDSRIVTTLGRMVPAGLVHLFLDNYWRDLGQALGTLVYLDDVVIEHVHPVAGKADWDPGYAEANNWWDHDAAIYRSFVEAGGITADAQAVLAAL